MGAYHSMDFIFRIIFFNCRQLQVEGSKYLRNIIDTFEKSNKKVDDPTRDPFAASEFDCKTVKHTLQHRSMIK